MTSLNLIRSFLYDVCRSHYTKRSAREVVAPNDLPEINARKGDRIVYAPRNSDPVAGKVLVLTWQGQLVSGCAHPAGALVRVNGQDYPCHTILGFVVARIGEGQDNRAVPPTIQISAEASH